MIKQQLRTDIMHGIGEIPMRHWPTFTNEYKGYPADGSIALRIYDYVKFAHDFTAAGFPAVAGSWFRGNHARARELLDRAVERDPRARRWAAEDDDLAATMAAWPANAQSA